MKSDKFEGRYTLSELKRGDWIIVGNGQLCSGWNSALDRKSNRTFGHRVLQIKGVGKTVTTTQMGPHVRFQASQVVARFHTAQAAQNALRAARVVWDKRAVAILELKQELRTMQEERFDVCHGLIRNSTNA